jgi:hypothetical protein
LRYRVKSAFDRNGYHSDYRDYLDIPERGFTIIYLPDLEIEDLIKYEGYDDFYILPAGVVPPNPAELLIRKWIRCFIL